MAISAALTYQPLAIMITKQNTDEYNTPSLITFVDFQCEKNRAQFLFLFILKN